MSFDELVETTVASFDGAPGVKPGPFLVAAVLRAAGVPALLAEVERLRTLVGDDLHHAEMRETGFGLQHPSECRRHGPAGLIDCPVNTALERLSAAPVAPGRYAVDLLDGELSFTPEVAA